VDDPKRRNKQIEADEPDDLALQVAQLQATVEALLKDKTQSGGISEDKLEAILGRVAQMSADAAERAANPSNKTHPGISVYSNPEGERANPRPPLKCQMFWAGYLIDTDTIHDPVTNNSRMVIKLAGKYLVYGDSDFATNATGFRQVRIFQNGTSVLSAGPTVLGNATIASATFSFVLASLAAGDFVEVQGWQNSGGNLNTNNVISTHLIIFYLGE